MEPEVSTPPAHHVDTILSSSPFLPSAGARPQPEHTLAKQQQELDLLKHEFGLLAKQLVPCTNQVAVSKAEAVALKAEVVELKAEAVALKAEVVALKAEVTRLTPLETAMDLLWKDLLIRYGSIGGFSVNDPANVQQTAPSGPVAGVPGVDHVSDLAPTHPHPNPITSYAHRNIDHHAVHAYAGGNGIPPTGVPSYQASAYPIDHHPSSVYRVHSNQSHSSAGPSSIPVVGSVSFIGCVSISRALTLLHCFYSSLGASLTHPELVLDSTGTFTVGPTSLERLFLCRASLAVGSRTSRTQSPILGAAWVAAAGRKDSMHMWIIPMIGWRVSQ